MSRRRKWQGFALIAAVLLAGGMLGWPASVKPSALAQEEPGQTVRVNLNIQEKMINILGMPMRSWTYNGTVPGPIVRLHVGDTLEMTLQNTHAIPHTLHTHFMDYPLSSDGSSHTAPIPMAPHQADDSTAVAGWIPGVAHQPGAAIGHNPIGPYEPRPDEDITRPGEKRTYTWKMTDVGVSWYHCHVFEATDHISRGLFGFIVIYPRGWSWEELAPDQLNGNTKAWVTNAAGERFREDVVIMSERNPVDDNGSSIAAGGGIAGGPIHVANFRAWNDPYIIGPVKKHEKLLVHVGSIGESPKVFHLHGHHFWRLWQMWHPWQPVPAWTPSQGSPVYSEAEAGFDPNPFTPTAELMHAKLMGAGEIMPILLKAGEPGFWFGHDHIVPQAYLGMVPWLHVTK